MRNHKIDLLRSVGLFMIVAAHLSPPAFLHQLRNFDVPLMVLISGASFQLSYRQRENYLLYVWKRFRRLVLPVWVFLTATFLIYYLVDPQSAKVAPQRIISSYLLLDSVDYLWIIRVFLLVALISPFIYRLDKTVAKNSSYFLLLSFTLIGYDALRYLHFENFFGPVGTAFTESVLYYLLPYGVVFALGVRVIQLSREFIWKLFTFFVSVFLLIGSYLFYRERAFVPTQTYKYPLQLYYLSYALAISTYLWAKGDLFWNGLPGRARKVLLFVSQNSIWIYLWHIPLVDVSRRIDAGFALEYPLVLSLSILITLVQVRVIDHLVLPRISSKTLSKNVRTIMTG